MEVKRDFYGKKREKAVGCLTAMGADPGGKDPGTWEGVMTMLEDVFARSKSPAEKSAAVLAACMWIWGHLECEAMEELARMENAFAREAAAQARPAPAK